MVFIVEEYKKKQKKKNHMDANLKYFMTSGCKAADSDTWKVKQKRQRSATCSSVIGVDDLLFMVKRNILNILMMYYIFKSNC